MTEKLVVVAIGGNALIPDPQNMGIPAQLSVVEGICKHLADIIELGWKVVITHGNGPQVGMVMRRSELAIHEVPPVPMDYAGADLQGGIGYMFVKALQNEFKRRKIGSTPVALVTQALVDRNDPAFASPTKPVGSWMEESKAKSFAKKLNWVVEEDSGRGWRRVVASPKPLKIMEQPAVSELVSSDFVVVACGGGGIPVIQDESGKLQGVEAVIDKDFASAVLAKQLKAEALFLVTGVEQVAFDFNTPKQRSIDSLTVAEAKKACQENQFAKGSMEPKIEALIDFVQEGGTGIISSIEKMIPALQGKAGTRIIAD